jgi:drug/metabolite transporter (DMT)-like permease
MMEYSMGRDIRQKRQSILLMALCAAMWSVGGIFIKSIPWNPFVIAGARSLFAAAVMATYMAVTGLHPKVGRVSVMSGVMLSLTFLAFVAANKLTTAANAIVLQYIAPVFILLMSILLYKQRFVKADYAVVAATIPGVAMCFSDQLGTGGLAGNVVALLSGLFLAGMFVLTGNSDESTRMSGLFFGHLFTVMAGLPMALLSDTPLSAPAMTSIVILGVFQVGIPYILYGLAVRHCSPLFCCLIGTIEPLLNPIWVFLFNGETPGLFAILGGLLVIVSITVWSVFKERARPDRAWSEAT